MVKVCFGVWSDSTVLTSSEERRVWSWFENQVNREVVLSKYFIWCNRKKTWESQHLFPDSMSCRLAKLLCRRLRAWEPTHVTHADTDTSVNVCPSDCSALIRLFLSLQLVSCATTSCPWFISSTCCCCPGSCVPTNTQSEVRAPVCEPVNTYEMQKSSPVKCSHQHCCIYRP